MKREHMIYVSGVLLGFFVTVLVQRWTGIFTPNPAIARENSGPAQAVCTNYYLVSFTVQTEGGSFMTGDISFASDLHTLRDLDQLRAYITKHIETYDPKPIARPTILNIVKL